MSKKRADRLPHQSSDTLARLHKLYSQQPQLQYDKFGRRSALPSEIANHLKNGTPIQPPVPPGA